MTDDLSMDGSEELAAAIQLLSAGVPLTLLLDLAGPLHSRDLYRREAGNADWLTAGAA